MRKKLLSTLSGFISLFTATGIGIASYIANNQEKSSLIAQYIFRNRNGKQSCNEWKREDINVPEQLEAIDCPEWSKELWSKSMKEKSSIAIRVDKDQISNSLDKRKGFRNNNYSEELLNKVNSRWTINDFYSCSHSIDPNNSYKVIIICQQVEGFVGEQ